MRVELAENLWVGDLEEYERGQEYEAYVSATKTIHKRVVGAGKGEPDYLFKETPHHLIFNWVDGPEHLFEWSGPGAFSRANDFIDRNRRQGSVLVHCDAGLSRSPTVCLTYLAKRTNLLPGETYELAREEFVKLHPDYLTGGIAQYVARNWAMIR